MRALILIAATLGIVGAAFAQAPTPTPPPPYVPEWGDIAPSDHNVYPQVAIHRAIGGEAVICCSAGPRLSVACRLLSQTPADAGFGEAALRLGRRMRLTEESHAALEAHPGTVIQVTTRFHMEHGHTGIQIDDTGYCEAQP